MSRRPNWHSARPRGWRRFRQVLPPAGLVIGPRIRASSTDQPQASSTDQAQASATDQPQTGKKKRVRKPLTPEKREAYNAKKRNTAEQRKYSGISYTNPNPKTKNDGYYTVCHKNSRKRFETKEEAREALKRYQAGECPVCGMYKPEMKGTLPYDPESDSTASHGTHSSSESESETEAEAEANHESAKCKPQTTIQTRAQTRSSAPAPAPAPTAAQPGAITSTLLPPGQVASNYLGSINPRARIQIRPAEGTQLIITISGMDTIVTAPFIMP